MYLPCAPSADTCGVQTPIKPTSSLVGRAFPSGTFSRRPTRRAIPSGQLGVQCLRWSLSCPADRTPGAPARLLSARGGGSQRVKRCLPSRLRSSSHPFPPPSPVPLLAPPVSGSLSPAKAAISLLPRPPGRTRDPPRPGSCADGDPSWRNAAARTLGRGPLDGAAGGSPARTGLKAPRPSEEPGPAPRALRPALPAPCPALGSGERSGARAGRRRSAQLAWGPPRDAAGSATGAAESKPSGVEPASAALSSRAWARDRAAGCSQGRALGAETEPGVRLHFPLPGHSGRWLHRCDALPAEGWGSFWHMSDSSSSLCSACSRGFLPRRNSRSFRGT